jgi:Domain of unknown function (DUF4135)
LSSTALLALAWLLGSADLHAENIVAAGPAPAIVDAAMISPPGLLPGLLTAPATAGWPGSVMRSCGPSAPAGSRPCSAGSDQPPDDSPDYQV